MEEASEVSVHGMPTLHFRQSVVDNKALSEWASDDAAKLVINNKRTSNRGGGIVSNIRPRIVFDSSITNKH